MKYPIKGTFTDLIEIVPSSVLSIMVFQKRPDEYVFNIDVQNGFLLVW